MNQPNIVVFLPDQLRPDFLSCYGAEFVETPAIDSIARDGVRFTRAVSSSPVCVPARTALLTGMHPARNDVVANENALRPDYRNQGIATFADLLGEAGYRTAAIGKMHFYPWDTRHGFQYRVIAEDKRHVHIRDDYFRYLRTLGLRKQVPSEYEGYTESYGAALSPVPIEHTVDRFVSRSACDFIRDYGAEQPFVLVVGFPGPHDPFDPDPRYLDQVDVDKIPDSIPCVEQDTAGLRDVVVQDHLIPNVNIDYRQFPEEAKRRVRHHYAALVKQIDDEVASVLRALDVAGLTDSTAIFLASDHGEYLGDHDLAGKGTYFESSIRIPLLARLPGSSTTGDTRDDLVDLHDLTSTMLLLAGLEPPQFMDSRPLPGIIDGVEPRESVLGVLDRGWMLLDDRYKLHKYYSGECLLFDLQTDPSEQHNLATSPEHDGLLRRMDAELTSQLMAMLLKGREHTRVIGPDGPAGVGAYNDEGWLRTYPAPALAAAYLPPRRGTSMTWTFANGKLTDDAGDSAAGGSDMAGTSTKDSGLRR